MSMILILTGLILFGIGASMFFSKPSVQDPSPQTGDYRIIQKGDEYWLQTYYKYPAWIKTKSFTSEADAKKFKQELIDIGKRIENSLIEKVIE